MQKIHNSVVTAVLLVLLHAAAAARLNCAISYSSCRDVVVENVYINNSDDGVCHGIYLFLLHVTGTHTAVFILKSAVGTVMSLADRCA